MPEEPEELFCPALTKAVLYQIRKPDEVIMEHDDRFKVVLHSFSSHLVSWLKKQIQTFRLPVKLLKYLWWPSLCTTMDGRNWIMDAAGTHWKQWNLHKRDSEWSMTPIWKPFWREETVVFNGYYSVSNAADAESIKSLKLCPKKIFLVMEWKLVGNQEKLHFSISMKNASLVFCYYYEGRRALFYSPFDAWCLVAHYFSVSVQKNREHQFTVCILGLQKNQHDFTQVFLFANEKLRFLKTNR